MAFGFPPEGFFSFSRHQIPPLKLKGGGAMRVKFEVPADLNNTLNDLQRIVKKREVLKEKLESLEEEKERKEEEFQRKHYKTSLGYARKIFGWVDKLKKHPRFQSVVEGMQMRGGEHLIYIEGEDASYRYLLFDGMKLIHAKSFKWMFESGPSLDTPEKMALYCPPEFIKNCWIYLKSGKFWVRFRLNVGKKREKIKKEIKRLNCDIQEIKGDIKSIERR